MRCLLTLFLAWACLQEPSFAEGPYDATARAHELEAGVRVRLSTADGERVTGRIEELTSDALRIAPEVGSQSRIVPWMEVSKIEMSRGVRSHPQGAWRKAKWGALIGAVPGAISLGVQHDQVGEDGSTATEAVLLGAWSGALIGGLIGAVMGATHPGEAWEKVAPTVRIGPSARGQAEISVAVTIEF